MPGYQPNPIETRFDHWRALAATDGVRLECGHFDVGGFDLTTYDELGSGSPARLEPFANSHAEMRRCFEIADELGIPFTLGIREPGHLRAVLAYRELGWITDPVLPQFYVTAKHPYGVPPTEAGLRFYVDMLPETGTFQWLSDVKGPHVHMPLSVLAVRLGGHVRTGLGDNPIVGDRPMRNVDMVSTIVDAAVAIDRGIADAGPGPGIAPRADRARSPHIGE